ncbi:MAG TPA: hypothetical protein VIF09_11475 [Polyangiaceae bacterium]
MRPSAATVALACLLFLASACSSAGPEGTQPDPGEAQEAGSEGGDDSGEPGDAAASPGDADAPQADATDAGTDGNDADGGNGCFLTNVGVSGECMTTSACAALGNHTSTPGFCPGPAGIECCTVTPNVADNPPVPAGWKLMSQSAVTPAMTTWAVAILDDPTTYPMFSTTTQMFGTLNVMARVEWHPPDFQNSVVHRGVTLYEPG